MTVVRRCTALLVLLIAMFAISVELAIKYQFDELWFAFWFVVVIPMVISLVSLFGAKFDT